MARVTRSRKVDVAEDHTALASQTPLPDTPAKSIPLSELSVSDKVNAMSTTVEEIGVASQVKHLKAAYREALGHTKRGKKPKKGKGQVEEWEGGEEARDEENIRESPVPEATRQLLQLQSREGSLVSLFDKLDLQDLTTTSADVSQHHESNPEQPAASVRLTRRQLATKQAGQYTSSSTLDCQNSSSSVHYFTSLFGGRRPAGSVRTRSWRTPLPNDEVAFNYGTITNKGSYLAEEALTASRETNIDVYDEPRSYGADGNQHNQTQVTTTSTPAKPIKTLDEVEKACEEEQPDSPTKVGKRDSFIEQITFRSPAKPVSRIEDSVEELDKLEDALEELGQAVQPEAMASPKKSRKAEPEASGKALKKQIDAAVKAVAQAARKSSPPKQSPPKPGYASMRVKSTAPKQRPTVKKATSMIFKQPAAESDKSLPEEVKVKPTAKAIVKRPASLLPPKEPAKSTKPPTRSTFELPGEAVARKLKEQREARLAQRESSEDTFHTARAVSGTKTVKSTKPPTKSTFELPGEAVSRRKKEAHEARVKAQEEEERKRREFKAKPLRKSTVPNVAPRDTVASRARQSRIGLENMEDGNLSVAKRGSVGAHRPSIQQLKLANMSAPRAPGPKEGLTRKPSTKSGPSMSGLHLQRTVSDKEVLVQRQRAKEIYSRDARMAEDMEREKQEREASARRAREEAAERGRQASRDWAEKQRTKKLAEGDKGLSAGYGPGGQMGLSG